jgi:chromosome segregation ATPase
MKNLRNGILGLSIVAGSLLTGCDSKEKARLQSKVDSLSVELHDSRKVEQAMNDVGILIDSIDASSHILRTKVVEGTSYADYIGRLKDINNHIKDTQAKLDQVQGSLKKSSRNSIATIKRLKADLELRSQEIVALQMDVVKLREENAGLNRHVTQKDSLISSRDEIIKVKESDVASLEGLVTDINAQNKMKVANLYYQQAQALETAANRTKFAPKKKKETRKEALELYKLSLSMGNQEAQSRIDALEKELS